MTDEGVQGKTCASAPDTEYEIRDTVRADLSVYPFSLRVAAGQPKPRGTGRAGRAFDQRIIIGRYTFQPGCWLTVMLTVAMLESAAPSLAL